MNPGADFVQPLAQSPLAPEQGTGPVTAHQSIKLRLLDWRTEPVSTGIGRMMTASSGRQFLRAYKYLCVWLKSADFKGFGEFFRKPHIYQGIAQPYHRPTK